MSNKTVKCKTCGNEIAAKAKTCPNCGAKNKKPIFKKPIFWIFIVIIVLIIGFASSGSSEPEIDYSKPDFVVTADEIMSEYSENAVSAKEKYGDKIVTVTGKVSTVSEYTVRLSGNDDENLLTDVVLSVSSGQDDVILSLSKGMVITATGKCNSTDFFDDIEIKNAKIDTKGIEIKTTEPKTTEADKEEIIDVDIDDLLEAYSNNSVAADATYKDKTVRLSGKIYSVEDGYIKLQGTDSWDFRCIDAYYNADEDVKSLKKDQQITIIGACKGEEIFGDIKINKCTIEK